MAQTQSSIGGRSTTNEGNKPRGAAYASAATREGESFKLSCTEMATNVMKVKVSSPFTINDQVNPIPALTMLLETALVMDPNYCIKSDNSLCSPIDKVAGIAKMKNIDKYAIDLQTNAIKKQFVYFVTLETTISFQHLKLS
jgi:hypothetical protein